MVPVFDSPQWSWRRAYGKYTTGGLPNLVTYFTQDGECHEVLVVIPTAFIKYLQDIHGERLDLSGVSLYAGEHSDGTIVLGYMTSDNATHDLWSYTRCPPWLDPSV